MLKKFISILGKTVLALVLFAISLAIIGNIATNHFLGVSLYDLTSVVWDITHADERPKTWSEQDKLDLFHDINYSAFLQDDVINENMLQDLFDMIRSETNSNARDNKTQKLPTSNTLALNSSNKVVYSRSSNIDHGSRYTLGYNTKDSTQSDTIMDYIFGNIFTQDNMDLARLKQFDFVNDDAIITQLSTPKIAALLDTFLSYFINDALSQSDINTGYHADLGISINDVKIDKVPIVTGGVYSTTTRLYVSVAIERSYIKDIVRDLQLPDALNDVINTTIDILFPSISYVDATIGLEHNIPVEIGINNLTGSAKYNKFKSMVSTASNKLGHPIELDEVISKPVNEFVLPLMYSLKDYIDVSQFDDNGNIDIDILGTIMAMSGVNDDKPLYEYLQTKQFILALKAVYIYDSNKRYDNWYYELDAEGNYVKVDGDYIEYTSYDAANVQAYQANLAAQIAVDYRLSLLDKDDATTMYNFKDDYTTIEEALQLNVDYNEVFDYLMAFFNNKDSSLHNGFYDKQFDAIEIAKRFADLWDGDITDEQNIADLFNVKLHGDSLLAIIDSESDRLWGNTNVDGINIDIISLAIKTIDKDGDIHKTLAIGLQLDIDTLDTSNPLISNLFHNISMVIEIDVTKGIDDSDRIDTMLAINYLSVAETREVLDLFYKLGLNLGTDDFLSMSTELVNTLNNMSNGTNLLFELIYDKQDAVI